MAVTVNDESWYVQQLIDNLRVPHNITPDMSYMDAMEEFLDIASVVQDAFTEISIGIMSFTPLETIPSLSLESEVVGAKLDTSRVDLGVDIIFNAPPLPTTAPTLTMTYTS